MADYAKKILEAGGFEAIKPEDVRDGDLIAWAAWGEIFNETADRRGQFSGNANTLYLIERPEVKIVADFGTVYYEPDAGELRAVASVGYDVWLAHRSSAYLLYGSPEFANGDSYATTAEVRELVEKHGYVLFEGGTK